MPGPNYAPKFYMPIIEPPPSNTDPTAYYSAVTSATTIQVVTVANKGLNIALSNIDYSTLFSVVGGLITFVPSGKPLPTTGQEPSPGAGSLVLTTWAVDVSKLKADLPPGVPPMMLILYLNVNPNIVRSALFPHVQMLSEPVLQGAWNKASTPPNRAALEDSYIERLLKGETAVFVQGGTPVGEAGFRDPDSPASGVDFTFRFADGAGNDLSPVLHIRNMPSFGGSHWEHHPLIDAVSEIAVPVNIYLQFEVWEDGDTFIPIPAGVDVELVDYDPLAIKQTDNQGKVHFSSDDVAELLETGHDLFFLVKTQGIQHAGHILPVEWSTKGWLASDKKSPGYYKDFRGTQLGDELNPLVFRIGVDFHVRLYYQDKRSTNVALAPKGILVEFFRSNNENKIPTPFEIRTDEKGEIHGIFFDVEGGDTLYLRVYFEIEDPDINLKKTVVNLNVLGPNYWETLDLDTDRIDHDNYFPNNEFTSLGTSDTPNACPHFTYNRNFALFVLKIVREWSMFLYLITDGEWQGIPNFEVWAVIPDQPAWWPSNMAYFRPFAIPSHGIVLDQNGNWSEQRETIIHELSHHILYELAQIPISVLVDKFIEGSDGGRHGYMNNHAPYVWTNEFTALLEGSSDFIKSIFTGNSYTFWDPVNNNWAQPQFNTCYAINSPHVRDRVNNTWLPLCASPNLGEQVEGALANGLRDIFVNHSVTSTVLQNVQIPESGNGDITSAWMQNSSVRNRFKQMIFWPLQGLAQDSEKTVTALMDHIRSLNQPMWHELLAELQAYNLAMDAPTITSISPSTGPVAGGQRVIITGSNFVELLRGSVGGTHIEIGGVQATIITVNNSTSLEANTPPGVIGPADVVVKTLAGSAALSSGYVYV